MALISLNSTGFVERLERKDVLLVIAGVVLVAFAFANLAGASTLSASYSSLSLSASRAASDYVFVKNSGAEAKTVSFSASSASGKLELFFDYYDSYVAPGGARGATLRVRAAEATRGCDTVTVTAAVCSAGGASGGSGGACETLSRDVRVFIRPAAESRYYVDTPIDYCASYYEPGVGQAGRVVQSRLEFVGYFDPTVYEARFVDAFGSSKCERIAPGGFARFPVSLRNVGAATSFDVRLIGDKDVLNAEASSSFVSLQRSGIAEFFVSVSPSRFAPGGRYYAVVQAQRNGVVVSEKQLCVEVEQEYGARLNAPASVDVSTCEIGSFDAVVENTGTGKDVFEIDVSEPDWALVATRNVEARGGQKQPFEVKIDGARLAPGVYRLGLKATSGGNPGSRQVSSKAFVSVRVNSCAAPKAPLAPAQASVAKEIQDEAVKMLVNIDNPGDSPIENVSVSLEGLPEKWTYAAESGFVVPAKSNRTLTVIVKRTTDEEADGVVLKIKSGDTVVGVQNIPKIESRSSGLTGFFVAASANTWIIALIIVVALAVVVLSGRFRAGGEASEEEAEQHELYVGRLRSLKRQVSEPVESESSDASKTADASAGELKNAKKTESSGASGNNNAGKAA